MARALFPCRSALVAAASALAAMTVAGAAAAKPPVTRPAQAKATTPPPVAAERLASFRVTGVVVYTQQAGRTPIRYGDVVVEAGRITCMGTTRPADEPKVAVCPATPALKTHDYAGKGWLIPSLVDLLGHVGVVEVNSEGGAQDGMNGKAAIAAHVRVIDALRLSMRAVGATRKGGVGFVLSEPQGNTGIVGQSVLTRVLDRADSVQIPTAALHLHVGDGARRDEAPLGSRSGVHAWLRDAISKGRRLQAGLRKAPADPAEKQWLATAKADAGLVALAEALERKLPIFAQAQRQEDIAALLRLRTEFDLPLVVTGAAEAHLLAAELAAAKVPVVIGPVRLRPDDFATRHATVAAASILHKAGVQVALASADSHNNRNLRWEAGFAADAGLELQAAIAAVTSTPAQIIGAPQLGQLQLGAWADFAVYGGNPLTLDGHVQLVVSGGELELQPRQP